MNVSTIIATNDIKQIAGTADGIQKFVSLATGTLQEQMIAAVVELEAAIDDLMFDMMADQYDLGIDEMVAGPDVQY